jgi:hypothetical protein
MNVQGVSEVIRIISNEFAPLKLLEMEMLQVKSDTFMETVTRIIANRNKALYQDSEV